MWGVSAPEPRPSWSSSGPASEPSREVLRAVVAPVIMSGVTADPLKDIDDQGLLDEVWRRFGASWCSFSSGVRSPGECPICHETVQLTRHHLVPQAVRRGMEREVKRRYVKLCRPCHELAHRVWGPGHSYSGPKEREVFVRDLQIHRDGDPSSH